MCLNSEGENEKNQDFILKIYFTGENDKGYYGIYKCKLLLLSTNIEVKRWYLTNVNIVSK